MANMMMHLIRATFWTWVLVPNFPDITVHHTVEGSVIIPSLWEGGQTSDPDKLKNLFSLTQLNQPALNSRDPHVLRTSKMHCSDPEGNIRNGSVAREQTQEVRTAPWLLWLL